MSGAVLAEGAVCLLVLGRNPNPPGRGAGTPFPRPGSLAREGGPIFPLRKGRQVVFGPHRSGRSNHHERPLRRD